MPSVSGGRLFAGPVSLFPGAFPFGQGYCNTFRGAFPGKKVANGVSVQSCGQNRYRGGYPYPPRTPRAKNGVRGRETPSPSPEPRRRRRFPASKRHRRPGANPEPLLRERFGVSFRFTPRRGGIGTVYPISRYMPLKRIIIGGRSLRYLPAAAIRLFSFTHD